MRTRLFIGLAAALFLSAACASQNPVSPSASGSSTLTPLVLNSSGGVSTPMDYREEQIVFSGQVPPGTFAGTGDVDFWVWCEHGGTTGNPQHVKNGYAGECAGSLTVNDVTKGVSGNVHMVPDASVSGMDHVIDVQSRDGTIACELRNQLPLSTGPTSTVYVSCSAGPDPLPNGTFSDAVVTITESPTS
jgi:hypothetical protein